MLDQTEVRYPPMREVIFSVWVTKVRRDGSSYPVLKAVFIDEGKAWRRALELDGDVKKTEV